MSNLPALNLLALTIFVSFSSSQCDTLKIWLASLKVVTLQE